MFYCRTEDKAERLCLGEQRRFNSVFICLYSHMEEVDFGGGSCFVICFFDTVSLITGLLILPTLGCVQVPVSASQCWDLSCVLLSPALPGC